MEEQTPTSSGKRKSRSLEVEPRSSAKRQRVPVSRFQSPLEDLEPKFKAEKEDKKDDNTLLYKKSTFLAVRGAEGSFYLCRTAQNIYKKSKRLRIQWLSLEKPPDVYKFDYVDNTEMETVLTEINMTKASRDSFRLPGEEKKRIEKILDRAIRVEQGIATADEVEEEALEDDDDESESEGEEEESPKKRGKAEKKTPSKGSGKKASKKSKGKADKSKSPKQNGKPEKKKGPDRFLKPNQKIKVLEKDPFFETKEKVQDMSARMNSKLAFRAVNLKDTEMLKELVAREEGIIGFHLNRSVHDSRTPLCLAMQQGNVEMVKLLVKDMWGRKKPRKIVQEPMISAMSTGRYNSMSLGISNVRTLNVSRGAKEGNEAFLKEPSAEDDKEINDLVEGWMKQGVSADSLEAFFTELGSYESMDNADDLRNYNAISKLTTAISHGHRHLAGKYVSEAEKQGGFGFNYLHREVLTFENEKLRDIILAASVRKKPFGNDSITPLHCAAINPNVKYITRLLSIEPDINILTKSGTRPIHFAAACEGPGPLEFLLNRGAIPYEANNQGEVPIHFASRSGRAKNIDVLMKYAKSKGDEASNPKWGFGCINRPNRFSIAPIHMAVMNGHVDVTRALIKNGADTNKPLSAGKEKVTPLMLAAQRGDLTIARLLIESGAAVEMLDKFKRTALTHAVMNGCASVVSYLLFLGADPDRVDSSNNSLVHYAAAYGWNFVLKLLLKDAGAKPDMANDWQTTPVSIAFLTANHHLVDYLFNHKGVDINFKTDTGRTLVSIAAGARLVPGLDEQIQYLIDHCKADVSILDVKGMSPLHHLAQNNIKLGGSHWNPEISEEAKAVSVKIAEILVEAGCDVSLKNNDGQSPVMLAIEQVNVELIKFLVEKGGTVSPEQNKDEKTILHLMAEQCCITDLRPVIKILVEHVSTAPPQSSKSQKDGIENGNQDEEEKMETDESKKSGVSETNDKPTPAGDSAVNGEGKEAMEVDGAIKAKPDVSPIEALKKMATTRDFLGYTPFLRACQVYRDHKPRNDKDNKVEQALGFIEVLLESTGSNINDVVGPKNMPDVEELHYTEDGKSSALHLILKAAGEEVKASNALGLAQGMALGGLLINPLLLNNANPTLLNTANKPGLTSEVKPVGPGLALLLRYSPNTNLLNNAGKSPLILAVEGNQEKAVQALLEKGADPNVPIKKEKETVTPLLMAAERGAFNIMKLLINAKASNTPASESKRNPIHVLVTNRAHEDETIAMIQTLLEAGCDINSGDKEGNTPLHLAVEHNKGHSDTSNSLEEFLLDCKANVFAKNIHQNMPLHFAVNKAGVDPIELCSLLTSAMRDQRVDESNATGYTPLLNAAASGATICCMHLLQRKARLEAKEHRGNTPLNLAVYGGYDSCAIMLMQRQASVSNRIIVSLAQKKETLVKEEVKPKLRPTLTWRPKRQWETGQLKDIPEQNISIFEGAIKNDLTGVAHMLLDTMGVPMQVIESALNLSKFYLALRLLRRIPDASKLQAKNKDGQNLFHVLAAKTSNQHSNLQIKVAGALLEKGVPLNERDRFGMTPLMWAALKHQSVPLAKFFIENDLHYDPKVKDVYGRDSMAAFMWNYNWVSDSFKAPEVESWMQLLIKDGKMTFDTQYDHPLPDPLLLGASIDCAQPDYFETKSVSKTTPLIFAIRNYNFGIAKFMLQSGANPDYPDSNGMTPMMHAVIMNDLKLVKLLLNHSYDATENNIVKVAVPKLVSQSSRQVFPINFLAAKEKNPDDLLDEEIPESEAEMDDDISMSKHTEENEDSVVLDEENEVAMSEDDIEEEDDDADNSDHDTDIVDEEGESEGEEPPKDAKKLDLTRHVSQLKTPKSYTSFEKTSSVNLSTSDKNNWTVLHHAVCALDYATFDNAEIAYILGKAGAPLEAQNDKGHTALALAQKNDSVNIIDVLTKLLTTSPHNKTVEPVQRNPASFEVQELIANKVKPDFVADAQAMLEKEADKALVKETVRVDDNCEMKTTGQVYSDTNTNIPYHVTLSKVDVAWGLHGTYNFYKIQLIHHTVKNIYVLFTRWGRIGDRGQFQHTPFKTVEEAVKEFCKVYKSKTGNDWNQKTPFVNKPKKYRLMNIAEKQPKKEKITFDFESTPATTLPEPIFDVVNEMSSISMLEGSAQRFGLDEELMPFGRIKRETLLEARKILTDISEMIDKTSKFKNNPSKEVEVEFQSCSEELIKLTNEYYHMVPISGFQDENIRPIDNKKSLRTQTRLLNEILDLQVANTILLGAKLRRQEINHVDYIYNSLGCCIQPLPEQHPETQLILTNIHASVPTANINRIFKISREGENERLAATNLPNHQLLWHGSSMSNFISILSRGLLVAPPEVPWSGQLFGEGVYFADTVVKSMNYCHNHNPKSHCKILLLCEVALGNSKIDVSHGDEDHLDSDINSLKILGKAAPLSDYDARLPYGASLSLGQIEKMKYHPPAWIAHNEYIIHNAEQIALRYMVLFNG